MDLKFISKDRYYVYKHYIIKDNKEHVFYIGKGNGDRLYNQSRNIQWDKIVESNNGNYKAEIISYCKSEEEAYKLEKELQLRYFRLGMCDGCMDIVEPKFTISRDIFKLIQEDKDLYNLIKQYVLDIDTKHIMRKSKINTINNLFKSIYEVDSYKFFTTIDMSNLTTMINNYIASEVKYVKKINIKHAMKLLNNLNIALIDDNIIDMNSIKSRMLDEYNISNIYDYFIENFKNNKDKE